MRTSLSEIRQIDEYLFNQAAAGDALVFNARLVLDPELKYKVLWQKKAHFFVQQYSRKKLRDEIEAVHQQLFSGPAHRSFRQRILSLFRN